MARIKLVENFATDFGKLDVKIKSLPLTESNSKILVEGEQRTAYSGYLIPVWVLDTRNFNERTYKRSLGERVCKEGKITLSLKDHPKDEGSVDNIVAVMKNPRIIENVLFVECYPVDEEFARKLEKIKRLGGSIGVSSSGFGELDEDGNVITESYELERYADFVLDPSYGVYLDSTTEVVSDNMREGAMEKEKKLAESVVTIEKEDKENTMTNPEMDKTRAILEKNVRFNLGVLIEQADKISSVSKKIAQYEDILGSLEEGFLPDVRENLEAKISTLRAEAIKIAEDKENSDLKIKELEESKAKVESKAKELEENVTTKLSESEALKEENSKLLKKLEIAEKLLSDMKEYSAKLKESLELKIAEANGMVTAKEYSDLLNYVETLESDKPRKSKKNESFAPEIQDGIMNETDDEEFEFEENDDDWYDDEDYSDEEELDLEVYDTVGVEDYYNDLVDSDPRYESVKREILSCKTVREAQIKALNLSDLVESYVPKKGKVTPKKPNVHSDPKLSESNKFGADVGKVKRTGWL